VKCLRLIVAVTLIALAGCGGGSFDAFIHELVTYCADVNRNVAQGLNNEEMAAELNGFVDKAKALRAEDPPKARDSQEWMEDFDTLMAKMEAAAREFEKAHDAQTAGNKTEADARKAQAMQFMGEADRAATDLGMVHLNQCAESLRDSASPNG
jgi:hypothetical protein